MKFQVGDKVKCIESISEWDGGPKKGEEFTIISFKDSSNGVGISLPRLGKAYSEKVRNGTDPNWGSSCFQLLEKPKEVHKVPEQKNKGWGFEND